jgi:nitroreductase
MNLRSTSHPEILPVISDRRSVRTYDLRPVEREKILSCIEAARFAPSAENAQPCRFVVLDDPEIKNAFGEAAFSGIYRHTRWALNAPVIVVICVRLEFVAHRIGRLVQGTPYYFIDVGIAGEHFVLQAQSLGLGTCWIGWFNSRKAGKFLKLPHSMRAAQLIALGYPHPEWKARTIRRKPVEEIVEWNLK